MSDRMIMLFGAGGFGFLIGWYIYFINRYRKGDVQLSDLVTLIGVIGGASITALFKSETPLFGAYGIGLFLGFFAYFLVMVFLVLISKNYGVDWFLDGRRKKLGKDEWIPEYVTPTQRPMGKSDDNDTSPVGG